MDINKKIIDLVKLAKQGQKASLNELAHVVQGRVYAYIYRVTLNHDLTQDLSQEVLFNMVRSIQDLEQPDRFWPWLYRISHRNILEHFRMKRRLTRNTESAVIQQRSLQQASRQRDDALHQLMKKDLAKKTLTAMRQLREQYRAILSLRCLDQLSYADIAAVMDCTEVKARALFFRAKQELKKQLGRQGVKKYLLTACLGLFGDLTAPAEAASTGMVVAASSTHVGLTTAILATATTKLGLSIAAVLVAGIGLVVGTVETSSVFSKSLLPDRSDVRTVHYTVQARNAQSGPNSSFSKGAYEQWYYFPEGVDGPVFMRMQRWDPRMMNKLCAWLQNGQGNYYYYAGDNKTVYIHNYRLWLSSLRVRELPSDSQDVVDFLAEVQGPIEGVRFSRDARTGLLCGAVDGRFVDAPQFQTDYQYNTLEAAFFSYNWPDEVPVVDERDRMHRRGWTYFQIKGKVGDQHVTGYGQIPFVYETVDEHPPWMVLHIGDRLTITDCPDGAQLYHSDEDRVLSYPAGAFFYGLSRPWMGIHTVDMIRRDAAEKKLWFETKDLKNQEDVQLIIRNHKDIPWIRLIFTIAMERDLVKQIRFERNAMAHDYLNVSYLDDVNDVGDQYRLEPIHDHPVYPKRDNPGMMWLFQWVDGRLIK